MAYKILNKLLPYDIINSVMDLLDVKDYSYVRIYKILNCWKIKSVATLRYEMLYNKGDYIDYASKDTNIYANNKAIEVKRMYIGRINKIKNYSLAQTYVYLIRENKNSYILNQWYLTP